MRFSSFFLYPDQCTLDVLALLRKSFPLLHREVSPQRIVTVGFLLDSPFLQKGSRITFCSIFVPLNKGCLVVVPGISVNGFFGLAPCP